MKNIKRKNDILIPFLTVTSDSIAAVGAFLFSYWLRFYSPATQIFPVTKGFPPVQAYLLGSLIAVIVWLFIFKSNGFYGVRRHVQPLDELYNIIKGATVGLIVIMAAIFFFRGFTFSRLVFTYLWFFSVLFIWFARLIVINFERALYRKGKNVLKIALVGSGALSHALFERLAKQPELGFHVAGYIGENDLLKKFVPKLGPIQNISKIVQQESIDAIVATLTERDKEGVVTLLKMSEGLNIELLLVPDLVEMITHRVDLEEIDGLPLLRLKDVPMAGWNGVLKRSFDVSFSLAALMLLAPIFLLIAIVIRLESKGKLFYRQKRIGLDGHEFDLIKFRSMCENAEGQTGPVWAQPDDSRVTHSGRFLRRFSLDEMPQFWNVLKGDMSLVGPRPERSFFVEKFKTEIPRYLERHRVKSGVTGWAQVNGLRGQAPIEERTKYDIYYIENWSLAFDLKIILKTLWTVAFGKDGY